MAISDSPLTAFTPILALGSNPAPTIFAYLRQVWLDTLEFGRAKLDFLIDPHGADRLCLGADYPFDMAEPDPIGFHAHHGRLFNGS